MRYFIASRKHEENNKIRLI